jgi:hypothetical protein
VRMRDLLQCTATGGVEERALHGVSEALGLLEDLRQPPVRRVAPQVTVPGPTCAGSSEQHMRTAAQVRELTFPRSLVAGGSICVARRNGFMASRSPTTLVPAVGTSGTDLCSWTARLCPTIRSPLWYPTSRPTATYRSPRPCTPAISITKCHFVHTIDNAESYYVNG